MALESFKINMFNNIIKWNKIYKINKKIKINKILKKINVK